MPHSKNHLLDVILCCFIIALNSTSWGQVPNDDMEHALFLELDHSVASKTHGCTVQTTCVDESLTGKCIDYHNDQWFQFNSNDYSTLYVNVSGQRCRDMRGVQIVVLQGEPCNTSTYQVLTCVSLANQNDIYVELSNMEVNQEYFIIIDGYLHDYCSFQIEVSPNAKGLPLQPTLDFTSQSSRENHIIRIEWQLPDSMKYKIDGFELFRRTASEFKAKYVGEIPIRANAFGEIENNYFFHDSIPANTKFEYMLTARDPGGKLLLIDSYQFYYRYATKSPRFLRSIQIPLKDVKNKESVTVIIYDFISGKAIDHEVFNYKRKMPDYLTYRTHKAIQNNIDKFRVKVINNDTKITKEYVYDLWKD